jgi:hypothetical protein
MRSRPAPTDRLARNPRGNISGCNRRSTRQPSQDNILPAGVVLAGADGWLTPRPQAAGGM